MAKNHKEKLLQEAYKLEMQRRKDPMMRKIYSDVRIYALIAELEAAIERERIMNLSS